MGCPFRPYFSRAAADQSKEGGKAGGGSTCPFGSGAPEPLDDSVCVVSSAQQEGRCPHAASADAAAQQQDAPATAGASCPYGFGSAAGPKLSSLHCMLCRTYMHDSVKIRACGHKYCRFCISRFRDCPTCGIDMDALDPDTETQALVAKLLDAHSDGAAVALVAEAVDLPLELKAGPAAFFLQLGMQAAAGGNAQAAFDRLELCKIELLKRQPSQEVPLEEEAGPRDSTRASDGGSASSSKSTSQLGAVYGLQADAVRRLGDEDRAAELYQSSINSLRPTAHSDPEACHALTVTINKLGDLHYCRGDVAAAREAYLQALEQRTQELDRAGDSATTAQMLDVAVSMIKVADACKETGQLSATRQHCSSARQLLQRLPGEPDGLSPREAAKLAGLMQALDAADPGAAGEGGAGGEAGGCGSLAA